MPFALLGAGIYCSRLVAGADHALCGITASGKNARARTGASGRVIRLARRDARSQVSAKAGWPNTVRSPWWDRVSVGVRGYKRARQIGQIAGAVLERGNGNLAGIDSLRRSGSLIIGEEENLVLSNRAAERSAELVLIECAARGRKVVARVEIGVAQEFESIAVKCVGAGFRDDVDLAAAELAIFRVEVVGENPELGDGIEVGNDRRAHVDVFFDVASIHHEAIGEFPLAVDRDGAGIQIAGGRKRAGAHVLHRVGGDGSDGSDARVEAPADR